MAELEFRPVLLVTKVYDFDLSPGKKQTPLIPDKLYAFTYSNSSILLKKQVYYTTKDSFYISNNFFIILTKENPCTRNPLSILTLSYCPRTGGEDEAFGKYCLRSSQT